MDNEFSIHLLRYVGSTLHLYQFLLSRIVLPRRWFQISLQSDSINLSLWFVSQIIKPTIPGKLDPNALFNDLNIPILPSAKLTSIFVDAYSGTVFHPSLPSPLIVAKFQPSSALKMFPRVGSVSGAPGGRNMVRGAWVSVPSQGLLWTSLLLRLPVHRKSVFSDSDDSKVPHNTIARHRNAPKAKDLGPLTLALASRFIFPAFLWDQNRPERANASCGEMLMINASILIL